MYVEIILNHNTTYGVNKTNNKNPLAIWYLTRDSISKLLTVNSVYLDIMNPGFAVKESV